MEVAPLIYSRTGQCDYNSKFAVRPKEFSEIQWARSKILAATRNIDRFNGIRRIVAAKNGVCIAGIVCTMKYFVNNCLTGADKDAAQPYIDVHGRLYGVFLGYSFKGNGNEIPDVNYSDLWQWFKEYLAPEWEKKSARTVEVDYFSWDKVKPAPKTNHGTEFYDSAVSNDKKLFDEYLSRALTEEVAFCSNVENIQAVEDGIYTAVTTSASNVDKLKANIERKRRESEKPEKKNEHFLSAETIRQSNAAEAKYTIHTSKPELSIKYVTDYLSSLDPNTFLKMVLDFSTRLRNNSVRLEEVMENMGNLFDNFKKNKPRNFDPTAQMIFDYEEHYMRLVKSYREEIKFINDLHTTHTQEVKNFYANDLPAIIKKLEAEPIADDVRREWLKHLEQHMSKSFDMSGHFIDVLTTKKVEEFNAALREKTFGGGVR